jgi:hypothetical protein
MPCSLVLEVYFIRRNHSLAKDFDLLMPAFLKRYRSMKIFFSMPIEVLTKMGSGSFSISKHHLSRCGALHHAKA